MSNHYVMQIMYAISLAWQLGFMILSTLGGFFLLGFWLDKVLYSSPLFLLFGIIWGFLLSVYEIYHMIIPLLNETSR